MGGTCSTHGRCMRNSYTVLVRKLKEKRQLVGTRSSKLRIILKWILNEQSLGAAEWICVAGIRFQ